MCISLSAPPFSSRVTWLATSSPSPPASTCLTHARSNRTWIFPSPARQRIDSCNATVAPRILSLPFRSRIVTSSIRRSLIKRLITWVSFRSLEIAGHPGICAEGRQKCPPPHAGGHLSALHQPGSGNLGECCTRELKVLYDRRSVNHI